MADYGKRPGADREAAGSDYYPDSEIDREGFPQIVEFLTRTRYGDGTHRVPGSLSVFVESGRLKVCLNDKDCQRVGFLTIETLDGLLQQVEGSLARDSVDWRMPRDTKRAK